MDNPTLRIFNLSRYRELFRDDASFDRFVSAIFSKICADGMTILTNGETVIATMYPANRARESFQLRIVSKLVENPGMIEIDPLDYHG